MSIRQAGPADAAILARLHGGSFDDGWSESDFRTWLARSDALAVIASRTLASREWEAVAFGLALASGDDGELLTIAARSDQRRKGLGRSILQELDAEAKKRGLKRWVLEVARNNTSALGLYKSAGFVEIGVRKAYYPQQEGWVDALVLSRPVGLVSGHGVA
jgi:[ribosomal protein S18]-alanine N-acetyltransferase